MRFEQPQPVPATTGESFTWPPDDIAGQNRREAVIRELRAHLPERAGLASRPDRLYRLHAILNG